MSSALHNYIHTRFRELFGQPDNTLGRDDHWSIKPDGPYRASINVLVNGTDEMPAVWVFDPHSREDGVMRAVVKSEDDLIDIVKQIQDRVARGSSQGTPPAEMA
jgi:hypothetical protein